MATEGQLQLKIRKAIEALPGKPWVVKVMAANKNGCPDLLCCYEGRFVAIEVKTPKGRLEKHQEAQIKLIKESGGRAFVARSVEEAIRRLMA